jgi:hypothetical protein
MFFGKYYNPILQKRIFVVDAVSFNQGKAIREYQTRQEVWVGRGEEGADAR